VTLRSRGGPHSSPKEPETGPPDAILPFPSSPPLIRSAEGHLTTPSLKGRGWTAKLIDRFLPAPDALMANYHHRSGPKIKLFRVERVEGVEASPEFVAALESSRGRKAAAARAVETKRR
jgi:hypothetical protein